MSSQTTCRHRARDGATQCQTGRAAAGSRRGSRSLRRAAGVAVGVIAVLQTATARAAPALEFPNLVPAPPFDIQIAPADGSNPFEPRLALRFGVAVANRGRYAFDLIGIPRADQTESLAADARECVSWVESVHALYGVCDARQSVGTIVWDNNHNHWHLENFVAYELRRLDKAGQPVMTPEGLVGDSKKVSFCIMNTERDPEPPPSGSPRFHYNTYGLCSLGSMGISPGWRDVYDWGLPGQQLSIDGVPDGTYALVVVANPEGRFLEATRDDNVAFARIALDGAEVILLSDAP